MPAELAMPRPSAGQLASPRSSGPSVRPPGPSSSSGLADPSGPSGSDYPALPVTHSSYQNTNQRDHTAASNAPRPSNKMSFAAAATKPVKPSTAANRYGQQQKQLPLLVGRQRTDETTLAAAGLPSITAAKPYIGKATFCVDNVAVDATEASLAYFVAAMGVDVLSCTVRQSKKVALAVSARHYAEDRKTFCLCIPREDSNRLLNPARWPAHISLSPWIFKKKKPAQTNDDSAPADPSAPTALDDNRLSVQAARRRGDTIAGSGSGLAAPAAAAVSC